MIKVHPVRHGSGYKAVIKNGAGEVTFVSNHVTKETDDERVRRIDFQGIVNSDWHYYFDLNVKPEIVWP